ncbi:hypothetical protein QYF36_013264 [Acer negundo]|nr:hypothetical protein QYF36_013264 [Acer negundo]
MNCSTSRLTGGAPRRLACWGFDDRRVGESGDQAALVIDALLSVSLSSSLACQIEKLKTCNSEFSRLASSCTVGVVKYGRQ